MGEKKEERGCLMKGKAMKDVWRGDGGSVDGESWCVVSAGGCVIIGGSCEKISARPV